MAYVGHGKDLEKLESALMKLKVKTGFEGDSVQVSRYLKFPKLISKISLQYKFEIEFFSF